MKTKVLPTIILIAAFLVPAGNVVYAQDCGCDYTVTASGTYDNDVLLLPAGSTICINAGVYTASTAQTFLFRDFRTDNAAERFTFKNCGGQVVVRNTRTDATSGEPTGQGIVFSNCKNFRVTGTGVSGVDYGILVEGEIVSNGLYGPKWGVSITGKSTDVEVDHVKVANVLFAGFALKTDPSCSDTLAWREFFTMRNVLVHHNAVSNTQRGEGFYIGYTGYSNKITCSFTDENGQTYTKEGYGHDIKGIRVYENIVDWTASDGIQVGSSNEDCEVHDNIITNFGHNPLYGSIGDHANGIQMGDGTAGLCYNNYMRAPDNIEVASGIKVFGINNEVFNNIIINNDRKGIYIDDRPGGATGPGSGYKIYNNTLINPGHEGIFTDNDKVEYHRIKNNIIIKSAGTDYIDKGTSVPALDLANNFTQSSVNDAHFVDPAADNYRLSSTSPCIDAGVNLYSEGVTFDHDNNPRSSTEPFDQGAFEYGTAETKTWHSYDIVTGPNPAEQGVVYSDKNTKAIVEFYESTDDFGVTKGSLFSTYNPNNHPNSASHTTKYWANASGGTYPYAGVSTVGRGSDTGEGNAPAPLGVIDLQLHPPNTEKLAVAAFIVPEGGDYQITGLAARRVSEKPTTGGTIRFQVFDQNKVKLADIQASNNQDWVTDGSTLSLAGLAANDRIYFAASRDGVYDWDFTEVTFTVKLIGKGSNSSARTASTAMNEAVAAAEEEVHGVYPNPVENVMHVNGLPGKETSVKIYNSQGRAMLQENVSSEGGSITLDVGTYNTGIYFIVLQSGLKMQRYKFLKK